MRRGLRWGWRVSGSALTAVSVRCVQVCSWVYNCKPSLQLRGCNVGVFSTGQRRPTQEGTADGEQVPDSVLMLHLRRGVLGGSGGRMMGEERSISISLHFMYLELKERGVCLCPEDHQLPEGRGCAVLGTQ